MTSILFLRYNIGMTGTKTTNVNDIAKPKTKIARNTVTPPTNEDVESSSISATLTSDTPVAKRRGRPLSYTQKLAEQICSEFANGGSYTSISKKLGISASSIRRWLSKYEDFRNAYIEAKETFSDTMFEQILELEQDMLAGNITPQQFKASTDIRKWYLSKLSPTKYGDKLEIASSTDIAGELEKRLATLRKKGE